MSAFGNIIIGGVLRELRAVEAMNLSILLHIWSPDGERKLRSFIISTDVIYLDYISLEMKGARCCHRYDGQACNLKCGHVIRLT